MKRHFGLQCHMVRVNRPKTDESVLVDHRPSQWAKYEDCDEIEVASDAPVPQLHTEDYDSLRNMVRELVVQSVIPFMERCVNTWNDQIASSRRSITGRFFGASRKYFSSSTKSSGNYNTTSLTYSALSPEAQLRKLADFAFMLRDYKFAYSIYELLKRDFQTDKAWGYLAGAQEMCANGRDRKAAFWMLLAAREWAASGEDRLPEVNHSEVLTTATTMLSLDNAENL
ncbi:hypothetical protein D0Z03_000576 [Geotrichum reessii]|nr:hypothetical protein D0Z03_000576 [Galactomyces reessii]